MGRSRNTKVTFHERPIFADQIGTVSDPMRLPARCGIVLQGPIKREDDFTLNTVRLYRRHFPQAEVIVSTWNTEAAAVLEELRGAGATVLTSTPPAMVGSYTVNLQIVSSFAGVKWCCEKGLAYVLKTRADQRFYAPNAVEYMAALLAQFPVRPGFAQKARILGISLDTFKYRLYGLSDHLIFGTSEDMHRYWSVAHDTRPVREPVNPTWHEASLRNIVEVYFVTEYLKAIGRPVTWTLEDSLAAYGEHFCVIDTDDIDLYWLKYEAHKERRMLAYDAIKNTQELTFRDWLLLARGSVDAAKIPQAGLHVPYGGRMY